MKIGRERHLINFGLSFTICEVKTVRSGKNTSFYNNKVWLRCRAILLYALVTLLVCSAVILVVSGTNIFGNTERVETRAQIKSRLMRQARYENWDPYSANMTLDEFYALMELFDEGKLPLDQKAATIAGTNGTSDETFAIPRTKFLFSGLPDEYIQKGEEIDEDYKSLPYDNNEDYEKYGEDDEGNALYYYPHGLDPYKRGYTRPPQNWKGVSVDSDTKRALVVLENENEDPAIASKVDQNLFVQYKDYYVKQVTVDGADINVLGLIKMPETGEYVCYFLSAEAQSTQVSTTTMPDPQKFIVQYVPIEHMVNYKVRMYDNSPVPDGIDVNSVFGAYHPSRTTDGAYSFDVTAPYGYTTKILICIDMDKKLWFSTTPNGDGTDDGENDIRSITDNTFPVSINHTGIYEDMKKSWLQSYYDYLCKNNFIDNNGRLFIGRQNGSNKYSDSVTVNSYEEFLKYCINQEGEDSKRNIVLTWAIDNDPNKEAHDSMLVRMTERINDFILHNNGYELGTYPVWKLQEPKLVPDTTKGPVAFNWTETFYNHLVKADRTIVAVLTPLDKPTFSTEGVSEFANMKGRGANAHDSWAYASDEQLDDYYKAGRITGSQNGGLDSSDKWPNIKTDEYNWSWPQAGIKKGLNYDETTGTYSYNWMFQTNGESQGYTLDVLEINGVAMTIPYRPRYQAMNYDEGKTPKPDENFSWQTINYLPDGAKVTVQFWFGWKSSNANQRHYRIMIEGAHTNVNITSLNLMMGNGAKEFSVYSLTGVHSDAEGDSQTTEALEYYNNGIGWIRTQKSQVVVDKDGYISYGTGDGNNYGANIRFKVADGFGNPYYMWESPRFGITMDENGNYQASVDVNMVNNFATPNFEAQHRIIYFSDLSKLDSDSGGLIGGKLNCTYIYYDDVKDDGYYYIRVTGQKNPINQSEDLKIVLLTIVARTVRYVVRYVPNPADYVDGWDQVVKVDSPENMPRFAHNGDSVFNSSEIGWQYDDNGGAYYDLLVNKMISIPSNEHGVIRPTDPSRDPKNRYVFVDWMLVDENYMPVLDANNQEIHFLSGAIDLTTISHFAVHRVDFSTIDMDINVIRFVPTWKMIDEPFIYNIVINWVDALGNVKQDNYSDWDDIITERPDTDNVYVYINKTASPFLNWFALHPTYTFWDSVNNALTDEEIEHALNLYLSNVNHTDENIYNTIFDYLTKMDYGGSDDDGNIVDSPNGKPDFVRLGSDTFAVLENGGTIGIWMYESLGGVVFNTEVKEETFVHDEEYYFTVTNPSHSISGTYRAFPMYVFNDDGTKKDLNDDDAWLVTFKSGVITSIVKDGVDYGTYFKLKKGEEVAMYVPMGSYTIHELGSKSGAPYKIEVEHHNSIWDNLGSSWELPTGDLWVKGSSTTIKNGDPSVSQVSANVTLEIGEQEIVEVLTFYNLTTSLSIENHLGEMTKEQLAQYKSKDFTFKVTLNLPENQTPFEFEERASKYYFNVNRYSTVDGKTVATTVRLEFTRIEDVNKGNNVWVGTLNLKPEETAVIVMTGNVSYWADEIETNGLVAIWTGQVGNAQVGKKTTAKCFNFLEENIPTVKYGYLVISETGGKSNESFLFVITSENGDSITVSVKGGGKTYVCMPLGKYTVEEMSDWSWRYESGKSGEETTVTVEITVLNATKDTAVQANYSHTPNNKGWLGGENSKNNFFTAA